jgi:hypothetical protein
VSALIVRLHVIEFAVAHPVQDAKVFLPTVAGAVNVTEAPALYLSVNDVVPLAVPLLSDAEAPTTTPLDGFVEFTVNV